MIRKLVLMKLEAVGLRGARDLMPSELSGGMARRVALARAIALDPMMILYDEPFTGQDPISMGVLVTLIRQLNDASGLTSIVVSHDVRETASIADHLYRHRQRQGHGPGDAGRDRGRGARPGCASSCTGCRTVRSISTTRRPPWRQDFLGQGG